MELLLNTQEERCRMEVYNEYLKKIPELLVQLETVEKMYEKALLEEKMLQEKDAENVSVNLYSERIARIKRQCEERAADIRQQCRLIMELKVQIENESSALRALMSKEDDEFCRGKRDLLLAFFHRIWYNTFHKSGCGAVGSVLPWGGRGRGFKSRHSDHAECPYGI